MRTSKNSFSQKHSKEDKSIFYKFQNSDWDEKAKLYNSFQNDVLKHFARLLIYEENPDSLIKEELILVKKEIAEKLLTTEQKPWITIPEAMKEIDDLRANESTDKKFLSDYDLFIQDLESLHKKNL